MAAVAASELGHQSVGVFVGLFVARCCLKQLLRRSVLHDTILSRSAASSSLLAPLWIQEEQLLLFLSRAGMQTALSWGGLRPRPAGRF